MLWIKQIFFKGQTTGPVSFWEAGFLKECRKACVIGCFLCILWNLFPVQTTAAPRLQEVSSPIKVVIDPGHGGENEGTSEGDTLEKIMTLETALAMYETLSSFDGIEVYMTRTEDVGLSLAERAQYAQDIGADFLFSIHYNASVDHDLFGSEVWISSKNPYHAYGYQFGRIYLEEMQDKGLFLRGVKTRLNDKGEDYYGIIRESCERNLTAVILEHCHVDEERDLDFCDSVEDLRAFGQADAIAVARYFGLSSFVLGLDFSKDCQNLADASLSTTVGATMKDDTPPDVCLLELISADTDTGDVSLRVSAADYDSPLMYYDYSTDGGRTYSRLEEWPGFDALTGAYQDTFTLPLSFTHGELPQITVRAYNLFDAFTESEPVTFSQPFVDLEKQAMLESQAAEEAAKEALEASLSEESATEKKNSLWHPEEKAAASKDQSFLVFVILTVSSVMVLLLGVIVYQALSRKRRRRRRKK